jgi:hypothetical protein
VAASSRKRPGRSIKEGKSMNPQNDPWETMARWGRTGEIPPSPYGPVPHIGGTTPVRKSNTARNVLVVIGVLVALTLAACFGAVGLLAPMAGPTKAPSQGAAAPSSNPLGIVPVVHAVGESFDAGEFRYQVHGIEQGIPRAGEETYGAFKLPQGEFARIDLSVTNTGDRPNLFDSELYLKLADADGRVFSADPSANLFGNGDQNGWLTEINPGNAIRAFVFFDLPSGAEPVRLEVTADMFGLVPEASVTLR